MRFANIKIIKLYIVCVLLSPVTLIAETTEVRKITPPDLSDVKIGQKILCHRPMRRGAPNMSVELIGDKVIANNYGHGGSGWTLGPGTADYVSILLINSPYCKELTKNTPITILGGGVIGLSAAYDLYQKGYTNLTIIAANFDSLTSHNAGGLLAPVSMDNDPATQEIINKIGIDAYKFYASIAKNQNKDFKQGAMIVPTYFQNRADSGLEPYVGVVMQPAKDVILDFGNGTTREMVAYDDGIFIDTAVMMQQLTTYLKMHKIRFVKQEIKSFDQIKDKFIMNCTGLGAAKLNGDKDMLSVQGHLIMLKDQKPSELQYMILVYFGDAKTKSGQNLTRSFYIFPKHLPKTGKNDVGVLGGTFIENATQDTPNSEEFDILLQNARDFYGIVAQK